jgi:prefoldin subunit 5
MNDILIRIFGSVSLIGIVLLLLDILRTLHSYNERLESLEDWMKTVKGAILELEDRIKKLEEENNHENHQ